MGKLTATVTCSAEDREELQKIASGEDHRMAVRARIILLAAEGRSVAEISRELSERRGTITCWKRRYAAAGISGLKTLPRGGNRSLSAEQFTQKLMDTLRTCPPNGADSWSALQLAATLGVSEHTIRKYLTKAGIHLKELRSHPWFTAKTDAPVSEEADATAPEAVSDSGPGTPTACEEKTEAAAVEESICEETSPDPERPCCGAEPSAAAPEGPKMLNMVCTVQIFSESGDVVAERRVVVPGSVPDLDDFDICTPDGFRRDFDQVETSAIEAQSRAVSGAVGDYLDKVSKKNGKSSPACLCAGAAWKQRSDG